MSPLTIALWVFLSLGGAAMAAPTAVEEPRQPTPTPQEPQPCPVRVDSLAAWTPAPFDAALLVDLESLRRALPVHGAPVLRDHLLEPLARAGFPIEATHRLALSFRPYTSRPDAAYGVAEGPGLAEAFRAWAGSALDEEVHLEGERLSFRARRSGARIHFSLAGGPVAPYLRADLATRPEESMAERYPCTGDPDTVYSLRVRRQRPKTKPSSKPKHGEPTGPIAWVRDYHLDLRTHGQGLEGVGHFEVQMPVRGFLWPLFGHLGVQTIQSRVEGCGDDLGEDPAGAWIRGIEFGRTKTGVSLRWAGPAREMDSAIPGLQRILRGQVGCSQRALPAALRTMNADVTTSEADPDPAPPRESAPPAPPAPAAPRGWLW